VRVGYNTKPYEKKMEVFQSFTGGLNTTSAPDTMLDSELMDMLNEDIGERGSLKRRHGLKKLKTLPAGTPQGYFRHYKTDGTYDEIFAISGQFYINSSITPVSGVSFQTTKPIEAVQFGANTYIATGTKLMQYDGTSITNVVPYTPTTMEMTYVGTNALSDNPTGNLTDTVGLVASIDQVIPYYADPSFKQKILVQVFCTVVSGESYEFFVQMKGINENTDWKDVSTSTGGARNGNKVLLGPTVAYGTYKVLVSMKKSGTTEILSQMEIWYTTKESTPPAEADVNVIGKCNRIFTHWGRLCAYGNSDHPATMYMSHLNTPNYFPSLMNLEFDSPRREGITNIIHYRNSLAIFTKSSTQALYGTGPDDYKRTMLHTDIGCIAPFGAAVTRNSIGFVSSNGIYALKTMGLTDDKATVEKLDIKIDNVVPNSSNAIVLYQNNQLHVTYPDTKQRFRFYTDTTAWTKDYSDKFNFTNMYNIDEVIYCLAPGALYQFDPTVYDDDGYVYTNVWESKYIHFGQPYHNKKLKEVHVMMAPNDDEINSSVYIYADENAVISPVDTGASIVNGVVVWNVTETPNIHADSGAFFDDKFVLGHSSFGSNKFTMQRLKLTGNCKRTRVRVTNTEAKENQFIGFAYIFKVRRPG
jgi:hypothetical protein